MDRVTSIVEHERAADATAATESEHRWEAAKLIWEELQTGQTKTALGELIGKSRVHVLYMSRCWEVVGSKFPASDFKGLPPFSRIYSSTEVRGEPEHVKEKQPGKHRDTTAQDGKQEKFDAAAWVAAADDAMSLLGRHRVTWDSLETSDIDTLGKLPDKVSSILREITARKASATTRSGL